MKAVGILFTTSESGSLSSDVKITDITLSGHINENNDGLWDNTGSGSNQRLAMDNGISIKEIVEYIELYSDSGYKITDQKVTFNDYGKTIFNQLDLTVPKGKIVKIIPIWLPLNKIKAFSFAKVTEDESVYYTKSKLFRQRSITKNAPFNRGVFLFNHLFLFYNLLNFYVFFLKKLKLLIL